MTKSVSNMDIRFIKAVHVIIRRTQPLYTKCYFAWLNMPASPPPTPQPHIIEAGYAFIV